MILLLKQYPINEILQYIIFEIGFFFFSFEIQPSYMYQKFLFIAE